MKQIFLGTLAFIFLACDSGKKTSKESVDSESTKKEKVTPFMWEAANIYFLLTDRFNNGDTSNDVNYDRTSETGKLRGFMGGDLKGITQKIEEGYFNDLGINAIWFTPVVEQIHGSVDEGTGNTYGFHGYWAKDWTKLDANFGTDQDLKELVETAHAKGIRVLMDAVINHTGPVTDKDPVWSDTWVRTEPQCTYDSYEHTIPCTLVANLPDIKTDNNKEVELPDALAAKWKAEGRYEQEVAELDAYFKRTGHPKAPRFYIMKWLTDFIKDHGIDGFRVDTVKHTEEYVWDEFKKECDFIFAAWKKANPDKVLDDNDFFMVGEVYGYGIGSGRLYDFGDKKVNYFRNGFNSLINFQFKYDAQKSYEELFDYYAQSLPGLRGASVLNYLSSHDDGAPFDKERNKPYETATKLLLSPGASQVYYGDESARSLAIEGTEGDATLRSFMNWDAVDHDDNTAAIISHWQKLGQFRRNHPAVGAGSNKTLSSTPYIFSRSLKKGEFEDKVVVGLEMPEGKKEVPVKGIFEDGTLLKDHYSNLEGKVSNGKIVLNTEFSVVLLEEK